MRTSERQIKKGTWTDRNRKTVTNKNNCTKKERHKTKTMNEDQDNEAKASGKGWKTSCRTGKGRLSLMFVDVERKAKEGRTHGGERRGN